ncbi:Serine/arginine-rich splicing factor 7, partial [Lemmus lemmus]
ETKVYVGNLGTGAGKGELERAFSYYGPLRTVWIARNPPGFAFVEFEDPRDAEDAVRGLDRKVICGSRVRVELSTGMPGDLVLIGHLQDVPLILMIDAMNHIPLPGVGEGGQDQHLLEDQGLCLFVDQDQLHSEDLGLVL